VCDFEVEKLVAEKDRDSSAVVVDEKVWDVVSCCDADFVPVGECERLTEFVNEFD